MASIFITCVRECVRVHGGYKCMCVCAWGYKCVCVCMGDTTACVRVRVYGCQPQLWLLRTTSLILK